ncbi:MAG: alpha/beta hydrolase family protein [Gemmatimonadaceae bacterium]
MPSHVTEHRSRAVRGGRKLALSMHLDGGELPASLLLPDAPAGPRRAGTRRAPAALLLHGYNSRKDVMLDSAGRALLTRGVASLAIDLPMHGERATVRDEASLRNPLALVRLWNAALDECDVALRYLEARPELDPGRLAIVGYSLGAYLGVIAASRDEAVRAVVLAAGGDLPAGLPFAPLVRKVADPVRAVRKLAGRPLLMVHGRRDRTILPDQAERLFAAAGEPKRLEWYDAGHWLPPAAIEHAAAWVAERLRE